MKGAGDGGIAGLSVAADGPGAGVPASGELVVTTPEDGKFRVLGRIAVPR